MRKAISIFFLVVVLFCASLLLFPQLLLRVGVVVLAPSSLTFEKSKWEGGKLVLQGVHLEEKNYSLNIDKAELSLNFSKSPLRATCHLHLIHPEVTLTTEETTEKFPLFPTLIPRTYFGLKVDIENGVLNLPEKRIYFYFASGETNEEIGSLVFSYDPSLFHLPLCRLDTKLVEKKIAVDVTVEEAECAPLLDLLCCFSPELYTGWEKIEGRVNFKGTAIFSMGLQALEELNCEVSLRHLALDNSHLEIEARADNFSGEFSFRDQLVALFSMNKCSLSKGGWGLACDAGEVRVKPGENPFVEVRGQLKCPQKTLPIHFKGKGAVQRDQTFWLETEVALGEKIRTSLSLCHPEKGEYVFQSEFKKLLASELSFLFPFEIKEGLIDGKATAWLKEGSLKRLLFKDIAIHQIKFEEGGADLIRGDVAFEHDEKGWKIQQLACQMKGNLLGCDLLAAVNGSGSALLGEMQIENGEKRLAKATFGCDFSSLLKPKEGWIRCNSLDGSFLKRWAEVGGSFDLSATFDENKLEAFLRSENLHVHHPLFDMQIFPKEIALNYAYARGELQGKIPLTGGKIRDKQSGLLIEKLEGECRIAGRTLQAENLKGTVAGIHFAGDLNLSLAKGKRDSTDLLFVTRSIQGDAAPFVKFLGWSAPFKGRIQSGKEGLTLFVKHSPQENSSAWKFQGKLSDAEIEVLPGRELKNLSCGIEVDSHSSLFSFSQVSAEIEGYTLLADRFIMGKEEGSIDLRLLQYKREVLSVSGKVQKKGPEQFLLTFFPGKCHFFQNPFQEAQFLVNKTGECLKGKCHAQLSLADLPRQLEFLNHFHLTDFKLENPDLKGVVDAKLILDEALTFELFSPEVSVGTIPLRQLSVKGEKIGNEWIIEKLMTDQLQLKSHLIAEPNGNFFIPSFELIAQGAQCVGEGKYDEKKKALLFTLHSLRKEWGGSLLRAVAQGEVHIPSLQVEGKGALEVDLLTPVPLKAKTKKEFPFTFSKGAGVTLKECAFLLPSHQAECHFEEIALQPDLSSGKAKKILVKLPEQEVWPFHEATFESRGGQTRVKIKDVPTSEGLHLLVSSQLERIQGTLQGCGIDLTKNGPRYTGSVKLDFSSLSRFLPQKMKGAAGEGYELVGDFAFAPLSFQGQLRGKEFMLCGYLFDRLEAQAELGTEKVILRNAQLHDPAGHLHIKALKCAKLLKPAKWFVEAPLLQLSDFRPSLLHKVGKPVREQKPFTIKRFTLLDLSGALDDLNSFEATGELHFTNSLKKSFSFVDLPLEMIKDWGLDPGLFTPIYGEIDVKLRAGKLHFLNLKNSYSDARRSQFFLADQGTSYLDLNGNLHLDLRMKQNVSLKWTEPFVLKVRGTLDKPKYGFKPSFSLTN